MVFFLIIYVDDAFVPVHEYAVNKSYLRENIKVISREK